MPRPCGRAQGLRHMGKGSCRGRLPPRTWTSSSTQGGGASSLLKVLCSGELPGLCRKSSLGQHMQEVTLSSFDSIRISFYGGEIPQNAGNTSENLTPRISVCELLVCKVAVHLGGAPRRFLFPAETTAGGRRLSAASAACRLRRQTWGKQK